MSAPEDMPAPELLGDVRRSYEDDLVNPGFASLEGIERDLRPDPKVREPKIGRNDPCPCGSGKT